MRVIEDILREASDLLHQSGHCASTEPLHRATREALVRARGTILGGVTPEGAQDAYLYLIEATRYIQLLMEVYENRRYPTEKWLALHQALLLIQSVLPILGEALPGKAA